MFKEVDNTHPDFGALDGYWKFNDGEGNLVAADSSGHGRDGLLVGNPSWIEGIRPSLTQTTAPVLVSGTNQVLALDGVTNYVDVPDGVWFNGNFTIELKAFIRAYSHWGRFLDFANGTGIDEVIFSQDGGGRLALYMVNGGGGNPSIATALYSPLQLPLNRWLNLAVTVQGTTASLYVDGAKVASGTVAAPVGVVRTNNWIGRPHWPSETYGNQLLEDLRIWNVARSDAQIRAGIAQSPGPGDPTLLLNYRFDEPSGTTVVDSRTLEPQNGELVNGAERLALRPVSAPASGLSSGTRYHFRNAAANTNGVATGQFSQFATLRPGRGTAVDFDGLDDQITGTVPQLPVGNSPYTIEAWIKPRVMGVKGIIGWGNYGTLNQVTALRLTADGVQNYWWNNDLTATVGNLTDGWHHVAASFDGSTRKIYVDGVKRAEAAPIGGVHNVTTTGNFSIGRTWTTEYFDGEIDEVRVWNIARSDAEVAQHMNERLTGGETGLVLYHRLDEGGGTTVLDATPNDTQLGQVGGPEWSGSQAGVGIPIATTTPASGVGFGVAQLNGLVNLESLLPSRYWFEYSRC